MEARPYVRDPHLGAFRDHAATVRTVDPTVDPTDDPVSGVRVERRDRHLADEAGPRGDVVSAAGTLTPDVPGPDDDVGIVARIEVPRVAEPVGARLVLETFVERWREDPRSGFVVLLVVALLAGLFWYRAGLGTSAETDAVIVDGAGVSSVATDPVDPVDPIVGASVTTAGRLVVHVSGAVRNAGVHELESDARVADAVAAAGGLLEAADVDRLNLAARVADGQRIHVPREGEPLLEETSTDPGGGDVRVNVNTASATQLETLPGVGPAIARAIVEERERRGGFRSVDELLGVKGIGEKRLEDLRRLVVV